MTKRQTRLIQTRIPYHTWLKLTKDLSDGDSVAHWLRELVCSHVEGRVTLEKRVAELERTLAELKDFLT